MQDAQPAPNTTILSAIAGVFSEIALLAGYAVMFVLTVIVVSASAIAYALFAVPRLLAQTFSGHRARASSSAVALWQPNSTIGPR